ncbi:ABC transporter substrate-binding protein [Cyanobacteria bacterium FACHB-DQ100]|uniref:glycine betaine ABC transporter substrate-binding protein n=1 Tax=Leptolyngbya sp. DQ-M1 TaxID=2933920 RepID=UPI001997CAEC|nr:ABC transporter substrate-binding protein [Cyanobacteria bacterium FACHB-DQ100]
MKRFLALGLLAICLMVSIVACQGGGDRVVIGSKNFTEQIILGEILAQQIERKTNIKVDRKFNLGGTFVCLTGIQKGELDIYPEYTGTAYTAILKLGAESDPKQTFETVKSRFERDFQLTWSKPFGFNNSFAMVIRGEDARKLKIQTLSQASAYAPKWRAGFGPEFLNREDGFPGLAKAYNLKFDSQPKVMDLGLLYRSLQDKQVDIVAGSTTDGLLSTLDLTVLQDDKRYFPPYEAAAVVRRDTFQKHPELREVLDQLGGLISDKTMQELNYRVDGKKEDVKQVVQEFLKSK